MKKGAIPATVDEYLVGFPKPVQTALEKLRQAIKAAAPQADEIISYQIPTYKYHGAVVHFAAFENHCSLFVVSKDILKIFEKELKSFKTSGTTIHFSAAKTIPSVLVRKIVKLRVKENEERNGLKKTSRSRAT